MSLLLLVNDSLCTSAHPILVYPHPIHVYRIQSMSNLHPVLSQALHIS
jgi:hypothetical protein